MRLDTKMRYPIIVTDEEHSAITASRRALETLCYELAIHGLDYVGENDEMLFKEEDLRRTVIILELLQRGENLYAASK